MADLCEKLIGVVCLFIRRVSEKLLGRLRMALMRCLFSLSGLNCTPPAIDDFPRDLFTEAQRRSGFVAFHVLGSLYLFVALAVVCDKYFVPAVEKICQGKLAFGSSL